MYKKSANPTMLRIIASALLILSSVAPWVRLYSDLMPSASQIINGFSVFTNICHVITSPDPLYLLLPIWGSVILLLVPLIGQLIVFAYVGLSIYSVIWSRTEAISKKVSKWLIVLLIISAIPVFLSMAIKFNSGTGWGSWAMLMSLGFAITIESISIFDL